MAKDEKKDEQTSVKTDEKTTSEDYATMVEREGLKEVAQLQANWTRYYQQSTGGDSFQRLTDTYGTAKKNAKGGMDACLAHIIITDKSPSAKVREAAATAFMEIYNTVSGIAQKHCVKLALDGNPLAINATAGYYKTKEKYHRAAIMLFLDALQQYKKNGSINSKTLDNLFLESWGFTNKDKIYLREFCAYFLRDNTDEILPLLDKHQDDAILTILTFFDEYKNEKLADDKSASEILSKAIKDALVNVVKDAGLDKNIISRKEKEFRKKPEETPKQVNEEAKNHALAQNIDSEHDDERSHPEESHFPENRYANKSSPIHEGAEKEAKEKTAEQIAANKTPSQQEQTQASNAPTSKK